MTATSLSVTASNTTALSGQYANYLITPVVNGNTPAGLSIQDNVGNTGTQTINSSVQYLSFGSGSSTSTYTLQNLTSTAVTLSGDSNVIAVDPLANAAITAGGGNDIIFGGANDTIYGGKGSTTVAFSAAYSNFIVTALYHGKNGAFSGYSITDSTKTGGLGVTTIDTSVKFLSFGGVGNGATLLTLSGTGSFTVSGATPTPTPTPTPTSATAPFGTTTFGGQYSNYLLTPLYTGASNTYNGLNVKDNVGSTGTSSVASTVQFLTFNAGQTSVTVQNLTLVSTTLSGDANVVAIDPTANASITGGSGNDVVFGGPNDTIYGGKGTTTVAFVSPYTNFQITPLYAGKNGAFSGFAVTDNAGSLGVTKIDAAVKYLSFGGAGSGATLLTLGSNGSFTVGGSAAVSSTTQGAVLTFTTNLASIAASSFTINDTNTNVASGIDSLQQNISKLKTINLTSASSTLSISNAQFTNDAAVLALIGNTYSIALSAVPLSSLTTLAQNAKVTSLSVMDSSTNISTYLDSIQSQVGKVSAIAQSDSPALISVSATQLTNDAKALALITGTYALSVSSVPVSSFATTLALPNVSSVAIRDTDANFVANLSLLNASVNKISTITLTDSSVLSITPAQQVTDAALLLKISGGYTITPTTVTLTPGQVYSALANQVINGVSGLNTVTLIEPYANFTVTVSGSTVTLKDKVGTLGNETLNSIQRVKFSDGSVLALDFQVGQNSFKAAILAGAAFGASLVPTYFSAAVSLVDQGQSNAKVALLIEQNSLIESQLGIANTNTPASNKAWVDFVYKNVVGALPDALSEAIYVSGLANGTYSRDQVLTLAINAADSGAFPLSTQINLTGLQANGLLFKTAF